MNTLYLYPVLEKETFRRIILEMVKEESGVDEVAPMKEEMEVDEVVAWYKK